MSKYFFGSRVGLGSYVRLSLSCASGVAVGTEVGITVDVAVGLIVDVGVGIGVGTIRSK